ncbi:SusC/RagA family TonB-linked outer membrane protein [Arthrospiribacter ruber]|uniref:TonB-dependent receptor n=1 Tax=Arthrospiribacter ruber TaxID=2487934 RepID=A0A951MES0_9BACT|nr:TonB-dependent receptor [Arthrospiribacter ruber]MBW3468096.1 TonB-dependent receptor [Arthrospiribacter ruber]
MRKVLLGFALMLMSIQSAMAQSRTVTGTVTSPEEPEGIPGVNVVVKGSSTGTITDIDGRFSINVPQGANALVFSFVGYQTREVALTNADNIEVELQPDVKALGEVVVVGYGTQERRELTGSVSSIDNRAIENLVTPSFDQQLAGRAPGVQVTTPGGVLGQAPVIRIRGVNSITSNADPLIVIDGVPVVNSDRAANFPSNPLAQINPADIESFEVLKDGSATAIFGSRAANGVILITTKKGITGKAQVDYNVSVGFNEEINRFSLLNGDQFVDIANEKRTNAGLSELARPGVNTDWQDYIFRRGMVQQHNLSIRGGSEATKYFFSVGFTDQEGYLRANDLSRYSFRANVDHSISDRLRIGVNMSFSQTEINSLNNGENSLSGVTLNATRLFPNVPIFDADNTFFDGFNVSSNGASLGSGNNLGVIDNNFPNIGFVLANNRFRGRVSRALGNVYGEWDILPELTFRTQFGADLTFSDEFVSWDPRHGDGRGNDGLITQGFLPAYRWNQQNTLNYQTILGDDHNINVTIGTEYQYTNFYNFSATGTQLADRFFLENNIVTGSAGVQQIGGSMQEQGFDSYFARVNYNYAGKYLLSASVRNDGISALPLANRRGTFLGGSVGWRISDEDFFNVAAIRDMKFRVSYAEVGNTEIGFFPYVGGFSAALSGLGAGIGYSQIANNDLQWETSRKFNAGLDMEVGRFNIMVDYFRNDIQDLVLQRITPSSLGVPGNAIFENVGAMVNQGIELRVMTTLIDNGLFTWNTDFNFTWLHNEVTNLINPITSTYNRTELGGPIAQLYGYEWYGVNNANGNPIYVKGDGSLAQFNLQEGDNGWRVFDPENPSDVSEGTTSLGSNDLTLLGNTLPRWQGGWSNNFTYGNWDAEIFFRYSGGNYIMNETLRGQLGMGFSNNNAVIMDRWTESGQETNVPRLFAGQDANIWASGAANSRFVERGDFLRVQNIVIGYRVPQSVLESAFAGNVRTARFFAQVQNPFLLTGYSGLDPELNTFPGNQLQFGVDFNSAPIIRTYSVGLNVGF